MPMAQEDSSHCRAIHSDSAVANSYHLCSARWGDPSEQLVFWARRGAGERLHTVFSVEMSTGPVSIRSIIGCLSASALEGQLFPDDRRHAENKFRKMRASFEAKLGESCKTSAQRDSCLVPVCPNLAMLQRNTLCSESLQTNYTLP